MADIEAQIHSATEHQLTSTVNPQRPQPAVIAAAQPTTTTANPQTTNPTYTQPSNTPDPQPQATSTNDHPHMDAPSSQMADNPDPQQGMLIQHSTSCILIRVPGEKYGDSSDGIWSMYLTEAEKQDKDVTESWKGDTEGILVFVSPTPSCEYSSAKTRVEDWSILRHCCNLHY